jgi:hypothetical protein
MSIAADGEIKVFDVNGLTVWTFAQKKFTSTASRFRRDRAKWDAALSPPLW